MASNCVFANERYEFRKGRSIIVAISDYVDKVVWALDGPQSTMGVFCGLSTAFDCVNHDILVGKMELSFKAFSKLVKPIAWD